MFSASREGLLVGGHRPPACVDIQQPTTGSSADDPTRPYRDTGGRACDTLGVALPSTFVHDHAMRVGRTAGSARLGLSIGT
ncbi:hypothetical protein PGT21_024472 [Puccinia graminis f. sp. tritici]|uniref:Uncharacterized protein n=1 Tax=Puccinia graminis f. sp. tritici TaxID=56615 RepID=A0A5B0LSC9_PUCGR|nr:hypothetical protein PGTUg99_023420 [Puccinia graminis f. sp. tritici]KAA1071973.1 hypothetical protein PGT21_024472 [Puccinia graminis f. sp. tritici]